jgi:o-succinylbenzoate synthase
MGGKIVQVFTHIVEVPLINEWRISLYAAKTRRHAVVEVVTEDGVHGFGEASPSPAFMGETADTIKVVVDNYLAPAVLGLSVSETASLHDRMNKVIYGNSAAKSAVDIAVHDSWGKTLGLPVYELIGGAYRKEVPLAYVVGIKNTESAYDEALKYIGQGYSVIKVKVGNEPARDIELVNLVRRAIADAKAPARVRLDANQGYNVATAVRVISELEATGDLESVEQPTVKWNTDGIGQIRGKVRTPIMIDETVFGPEDAMKAVKQGIADIINLKVCKVGGLYQARKIAAMAEASGMSCVVGSNLELGIGIAASLHFVASTPVVNMACDFFAGSYLHEYDLVHESIPDLIEGGRMKLIAGPGLGVTFKA